MLYQHYKKKFYKYLGIVRHSETLEELALYDCLYENELGRHWVRPKDLFFGKIKTNGQEIDRFKKVDITVKEYEKLDASHLDIVYSLCSQFLGNLDRDKFLARLSKESGYYLLIAEIDARPVGLKLGYKMNDSTFYSWLGGVISEFRGLGVATELMQRQHQWCKAQGYIKVRTKTRNSLRNMILLNVKFGFDVIGIENENLTDDLSDRKIIFEKMI